MHMRIQDMCLNQGAAIDACTKSRSLAVADKTIRFLTEKAAAKVTLNLVVCALKWCCD